MHPNDANTHVHIEKLERFPKLKVVVYAWMSSSYFI